MRLRWRLLALLALLIVPFAARPAQAGGASGDIFEYQTAPGPVQVVPGRQVDSLREYLLSWSSGFISPYAENNLVRARFFTPVGGGPFPAVVVLHAWKAKDFTIEKELCRRLAKQGMAALLLVLPYHGERAPAGSKSGALMLTADVSRTADAIRQAVMDVKSAVDWLQADPHILPDEIGITGISLGAIIADLAMGVDSRIKVGVSLVGGGDLPYIVWHSLLTIGIKRRLAKAGFSLESLEEILRPLDPVTYAHQIPPRRLLMINGTEDLVIPRHAVDEFWKAAAQPSIIWLPTGHYGPFLTRGKVFQLTADYLKDNLKGEPLPAHRPALHPITLKFVGIYDHSSGLRFGVFVELAHLEPKGRSSGDLGLTTKGPFAALSWHVSKAFDLGLGSPLKRTAIRPFVSARLTF